jgi:NADH dehydrogenase
MSGAPVPVTAQAAVQQAKIVARNIVALVRGSSLEEFQFQHRGDLVSLGRGKAVAHLYGISFDNWFAWWLWRTVYLMKLVGWGNRVRVVVDWTLDLFHPRDMNEV